MTEEKKEKLEFYQSPRWSAEIADCSMPMTFDQYSNCTFGCLYCFSQYQRALGKSKVGYLLKRIRHVDVEKVKRIFLKPEASQFGQYVKERRTMQWGGLSDPFDPVEHKLGIGLELLKFFKEIDYPICFSTKATWWAEDKRYVDLFRGQKNWNVKVSIITLDARKALAMEVGVPPPLKRIEAIKAIANFGGGGATLRLRPFIIGITDPTHIELIKKSAEAGATAISTEFFCLENRSPALKRNMKIFDELCGFNVLNFYKKYSYAHGYLRLNRNIKRKFVDEMQQACRDSGIRFYVSDAHFKERCDNGSCCGLPPEFNYSRGQFTEALMICKRDGIVKWSDLEPWLQYAKQIPFCGAAGFNTNSTDRRAQFYQNNMYDYLRHLWNDPNAGQSPYKMFEGIMKPEKLDEAGNVVYIYDKNRE